MDGEHDLCSVAVATYVEAVGGNGRFEGLGAGFGLEESSCFYWSVGLLDFLNARNGAIDLGEIVVVVMEGVRNTKPIAKLVVPLGS